MDVIVAHEKYGTFVYSNALELLDQRINREAGQWYFPEDEAEATRILLSHDEDAAWRFLLARKDHEYEYVEKQQVR